jgi:hypothetical protein
MRTKSGPEHIRRMRRFSSNALGGVSQRERRPDRAPPAQADAARDRPAFRSAVVRTGQRLARRSHRSPPRRAARLHGYLYVRPDRAPRAKPLEPRAAHGLPLGAAARSQPLNPDPRSPNLSARIAVPAGAGSACTLRLDVSLSSVATGQTNHPSVPSAAGWVERLRVRSRRAPVAERCGPRPPPQRQTRSTRLGACSAPTHEEHLDAPHVAVTAPFQEAAGARRSDLHRGHRRGRVDRRARSSQRRRRAILEARKRELALFVRSGYARLDQTRQTPQRTRTAPGTPSPSVADSCAQLFSQMPATRSIHAPKATITAPSRTRATPDLTP